MSGALRGIGQPRMFFDGIFSTPRLDHPECVAVHPDGSVTCCAIRPTWRSAGPRC